MPHYTEGELQAYLDAEVAAPAREEIAAHLDMCSVCEGELATLQGAAGLFTSAVWLSDVRAPAISPANLRARSRAEMRWQPGRWSRGALVRAAMLILGLAAAASAAVPDSPLRRWVETAWRELTSAEAPQPVPSAEPVQPAPIAPTPAPGFAAIEPVEGHALVRLIDAAPGIRIRVLLVDSAKVTVTAAGAASNAQLGTGTGRLDVTGAGPGVVTVQLPRGLPNATVQVNGRTWMMKTGEEIRFPGPAPDQTGDEIIFQTR